MAPARESEGQMNDFNRAEIYVDYFQVFYGLADERCRKYWGTSRPNGQAAGLESLVHFGGRALKLMKTSTVFDAGAGVSSAVIRTYFKDVVTFDPDAEYLAQVRTACEQMGLGHGRWVVGVPEESCDACFYDYGTHQRIPTLSHFLDRTRRLFWLDDAHDAELLSAADGFCRSRGLMEPTRAIESVDEHGRFGAYVLK